MMPASVLSCRGMRLFERFSLRGCLRVVLVVVLSVLAACGRGGDGARGGGGPSASAVSASATASPTVDLPADQAAAREAALAMPAPEKPENMDENSSEGAIATATYFVQLYPYVYATGDLEQWKSMRLIHRV